MRKFLSPDKQGLVICSIRPQTQGNSVYSFPHIFISQKLLTSLKLKWGQSIILSARAGGSKDLKTCKAFVFVEEKLGEKETAASQGVCKELRLREKDQLQIQCWNPKSPESMKLRRKITPQILHLPSEEIKQLTNQFNIFSKNNEIELIAGMFEHKLQVQVKCFREMKAYSQQFQDKVQGFRVEEIFKMLRDPKKYQYIDEKKSIIINLTDKKIQLKLKKCSNSLRLSDTEILFNALDKMNEKMLKLEQAQKGLNQDFFKKNQSNQSTTTKDSEQVKGLQHTLPISNIKLKKYNNRKDRALRFEQGEDTQMSFELARIKKKLQSMDFKVDEICLEKSPNIQMFKMEKFSELIDKKFSTIIDNIDKLSEEIQSISHKTMYSYLLQKQQSEELKLRLEMVEDEVKENKQRSKDKENMIERQLKDEIVNARKILQDLNQQRKIVTKQHTSLSNSMTIFKNQSLKVDFGSKFINQFLVEGHKILRMGTKGWTQLATTNNILPNAKLQYKIKVIQSKFNFVMFGIVSEQCMEEKSSWTSENCYAYFGWNGNVYLEGQCALKEGRGFKHGETVSLKLNMQQGLICWAVNNQIVFECKRKHLKNSHKKWFPYIQMFSPGDQVQFIDANA